MHCVPNHFHHNFHRSPTLSELAALVELEAVEASCRACQEASCAAMAGLGTLEAHGLEEQGEKSLESGSTGCNPSAPGVRHPTQFETPNLLQYSPEKSLERSPDLHLAKLPARHG